MPSTCSTAKPFCPAFGEYQHLQITRPVICFLSTNLSWSQHIKNLCTKVRKVLGLIYRRFNHFSTPESLSRYIFHSFFPIWRMAVKYGALTRLGKLTLLNASKRLHYVCVLKAGRVATTSYCSCSLYRIFSNPGFTWT